MVPGNHITFRRSGLLYALRHHKTGADRVRSPILGPLARLQRGASAVTDGPVATQVLQGGRPFRWREEVL